jgi:phenylalanyl-tRNA synthetase beta chain
LLVTGYTNSENWTFTQAHADFFYFKGIIESILLRLGISDFSFSKISSGVFSEALSFHKNKADLVTFGRVNQQILKKFNIDQNVLYADFNWKLILKLAKKNSFTFQEIPKFPSVRRDFALLVDESVSFNAIAEIAYQTDKKILKAVNLFDVYQGENLPEGKKSYAVSFIFQDAHKTLTDKQIDKTMDKFLKQFENDLSAILR